MQVIDYSDIRRCENNFIKLTLSLAAAITPADVAKLAAGNVLVSGVAAGLPYFKIVAANYTLRGAVGNSSLTVDCHTTNKAQCKEYVAELLRQTKKN